MFRLTLKPSSGVIYIVPSTVTTLGTCMLRPCFGYVAIFYLYMCFCVVPACVMFGCVRINTIHPPDDEHGMLETCRGL